MKTITHGLFIYLFLTTTYEISSTALGEQPHENDSQGIPKCILSDVITKSSEYADKCKQFTNLGTEVLGNLTSDNLPRYRCTGIYETANRICELKINSLPKDTTIFRNEINKLQPLADNLTTFCSAINRVISNKTYISAMNSTITANTIQLNKNLRISCKDICWNHLGDISVNHLCIILLWENEIIANYTLPAKFPAANNQPYMLDAVAKPGVPKLSQELISGHKPAPVAHDSDNVVKNPQREASGNSEKVNNSKATPLETSQVHTAVLKHEHAAKPKMPGIESSHDSPQTGDAAATRNDQFNDQTGAGTVAKIPQSSEAKVKPATGESIDPQLSGGIAGNGDIKVPVGSKEGVGVDEKPGVDSVDIVENTNGDEDDEEPGVSDTGESPQLGEKPIDNLNPSNQIPGTSPNHDEEVKPGGLKKEAIKQDKEGQSVGLGEEMTNQESSGLRDHSLAHSGPLDPPQHFFAYFMAVSFICLLCYIGYHKKHKIMAIIFEGRKSRGGRGRRRPNTAGYRKLDCNLEEAVTSQCNSNVTHVIY